jgi:hypothetical protein
VTSTPSLDDYRWLVGDEAAGLLSHLAASSADLLTLASQLRGTLSSARSHLALEQVELRRRAGDKFARAAEMLFTPIGLEQSTDEVVARYKARRFASGEPVTDLCCGIGGDLLALAERGPAVGVDANPAVALLAEANCRRMVGGSGTHVEINQVETFSLAGITAWHADPDRRATGRRTTRVEAYQPGLETLERLRQQCSAGAIKLAPAAEAPDHWIPEAEMEWISRRGQCRQLVAWFGTLARWPGQRAATIVAGDGAASRTLRGSPCDTPLEPRLGRYVFEPDPAVLAAHLTCVLAEQHQLHAFEPGIGYLTGDEASRDLALAAFEVLDVLPLDTKQLRRYLQHHHVGRLEVKKRGVQPEPDAIRRQLIGSCRGDQPLVLLLTRLAGRTVAIAAGRLA